MKTQKLLASLLVITSLAFFSACAKLDEGIGITGQGPMLEETHQTDAFKNIEVDVDADVFLTQDRIQALRISGQENILSNLNVSVSEMTLRINYIDNINTHDRLQIYINLPVLANLSTARGAKIRSLNTFEAELMLIEVYGSGIISMNIAEAEEISTSVAGSGHITLTGKSDELRVVINGPGYVATSGLISKHGDVRITGSGKCEVNSADELTVNINGNGKVLYVGNPTTLISHLSGNGEIRSME
jgi:hypothetical protein